MDYLNLQFDEERALYGIRDARVADCVFAGPADGESPLKETSGVRVENCRFELRYPFWHMSASVINGCALTESCRAAFWYDKDLRIENSRLHGIKALRECENIRLEGCDAVSQEFGWKCRGFNLDSVALKSEYPFFECESMRVEKLTMEAKYSFQYVRNAVLKNCVLKTKDAFWHSKDVTVYDSVIDGEYLGWYSENLRLVNCRITGTQPLCYCRGLKLENCTMERADLCFEKSEVEAAVSGRIDSVKNPLSGRIRADEIGEIIRDGECGAVIETGGR